MADKIYEFLFRGGLVEDGKSRGNTFHVILDSDKSTAMTPQQAADKGWPIKSIVADINEQLMQDLLATKSDLATSQAEVEKVKEADAAKGALLNRLIEVAPELAAHIALTTEMKTNG